MHEQYTEQLETLIITTLLPAYIRDYRRENRRDPQLPQILLMLQAKPKTNKVAKLLRK